MTPSTVDVLTPGDGQGEDALDPTIKSVLEQGFANQHDAAQAARERRRDAMDNVAEQSKLLFLEEKFKVGQREAEASRRLDDNKLAENILAQRATKDQPDKAA